MLLATTYVGTDLHECAEVRLAVRALDGIMKAND